MRLHFRILIDIRGISKYYVKFCILKSFRVILTRLHFALQGCCHPNHHFHQCHRHQYHHHCCHLAALLMLVLWHLVLHAAFYHQKARALKFRPCGGQMLKSVRIREKNLNDSARDEIVRHLVNLLFSYSAKPTRADCDQLARKLILTYRMTWALDT